MSGSAVYKEIGDGSDLESVGVVGVLDMLHGYAYAPITEEDSARARCRCPEHVDTLCDYIAARENLRHHRVYPAFVMIGYGSRLHNIAKNADTISGISERMRELRMSDVRKDRKFAKAVEDMAIDFSGDTIVYRFERNIVAQINNCANECGSSRVNLYFYFFLNGIKELVENDDGFSVFSSFSEYKKAMRDLEDIDDSFEEYKNLIGLCISK